jgi:transcriptional regulator with XRE-family HTH domain
VREKGGPPQPDLLRLGLQIREAREELGLSAEALAERSGLSPRGLLYIEHGRRNPSFLTLLAIADGLNSSVAALTQRSVRKLSTRPRDVGARTSVKRPKD